MAKPIRNESFPVTVQREIGTVELDPYSDLTSTEAAFRLVARYDEPGIFQFQIPGSIITTRVTVDHIEEGNNGTD